MKAIKLLLTALALLIALRYLRHTDTPYPWQLYGVRERMEADRWVTVEGRLS